MLSAIKASTPPSQVIRGSFSQYKQIPRSFGALTEPQISECSDCRLERTFIRKPDTTTAKAVTHSATSFIAAKITRLEVHSSASIAEAGVECHASEGEPCYAARLHISPVYALFAQAPLVQRKEALRIKVPIILSSLFMRKLTRVATFWTLQ
jgi:hypothetical protein